MQQITGNITNVVPTQGGGYQSQNGYIFTYNLTIQTEQGSFTGIIGSKKQPYPVAVGQQISVEWESTEHGTKFKKFNAQYANQGQPQGAPPQQAPPQQAPSAQSYSQPQPATQQPATSQGMVFQDEVRMGRGCSLKAVLGGMEILPWEIGAYLTAGTHFIDTGIWNPPQSKQQADPQPANPNPQQQNPGDGEWDQQ